LLLLPPMLLVLAASRVWRDSGARLRPLGRDVAALAAMAALTMLLGWPALLADPAGTVTQVLRFSEQTADAGPDSFFLGAPTSDPGLGFYPLVLAFRLSPVLVVGLALWAITARRRRLAPRLSAGGLLACAVAVVLV